MSTIEPLQSGGAGGPEASVHKLEAQRRVNREALAATGLDPYGGREEGIVSLAEAAARYDEGADAAYQAAHQAGAQAAKEGGGAIGGVDPRPVVKVAGRIVLRRPTGKLIWMNLRDHTRESFQIAVSKKDADAAGFACAELADLGDVVVAEGPLMRTKTGEVTCWARTVRPASKCLLPPPEKHAGLTDHEQRYRRRYVDMWANPQTTRVFELRSRIVAEMRRLLTDEGYLEVETPMLQVQAGGAAARPFATHMNALDLPLFMRIAPELYLKRLLVGGLPRVFEINKNFRNEGIDKNHNPEFTVIELYEAFGDYHTVMATTERIIRACAGVAADHRRAGGRAIDGLRLPFGDLTIDYAAPFRRETYAGLFERAVGVPMDDRQGVRAEAARRGVAVKNEKGQELDHVLIVNELFEEFAEKLIDPAVPTWVMDYPASLSPLTRPRRDDAGIAERADLFIAGMEIGPHYTELNNPDVQEAKFREQLGGLDEEESTFRTFDQDFIDALKTGMPPAGGMGLGIDRLMMLLADQPTIRDVVLFPLMRPV